MWRRSRRELNPDGSKCDLAFIQGQWTTLGNEGTLWNNTIGRHWSKHVQVVSHADAAELVKRDIRTYVEQEQAAHPERKYTADEYLDLVIQAGSLRVLADPSRVTVDQATAATRVKQQSKTNEATAEMMKMLGRGIGAALSASTAAPTRRLTGPMDENGNRTRGPNDVIEVEAEVVTDAT